MIKFKIGDVLIRTNFVQIPDNFVDKPRKIKIVGYSSLRGTCCKEPGLRLDFNVFEADATADLNVCNGYIFQNIFTGKKEYASYEYVEYYYYLDQRKEKIQKIEKNGKM
jgi:hypothetical protein